MGELINNQANRATTRRKLLSGASAMALIVSLSSVANAGDATRPPLWIEVGGQLNRMVSHQGDVNPPFFAQIAAAGFTSPLDTEKASKYSVDEYGKLSLRPGNSDWVFSASLQYGRSNNNHRVHQNTTPPTIVVPTLGTIIPSYGKFVETQWRSGESHTILDFEAGKDVGLGAFGHHGTSEIGIGVRIAQLSSASQAFVNADPTLQYPTHPTGVFDFLFHDLYRNTHTENDSTQRSFNGIGPALSWQGTSPFAGSSESTELSIDWSAKAALLFGRQKARGHHQSSSDSCPNYLFCLNQYFHSKVIGPDVVHNRSRSVTVPNISGSVGLSFRTGNARVSLGYRADLFINAMDTGIDTAKKSNVLMHGPYASVSIGLGD